MDKISKKKIKELKKEHKYDEIYLEFGKNVYNKNVPYKYIKKDLKKLRLEGRYEDIFIKYGENEYEKLLDKAKYNEIKEAKGKISAIFWKIKNKTKKFMKIAGITIPLVFSSAAAGISYDVEKQCKENAKIYKNEIKEYNDKIEEYAKDINKMELNDIQIFMKVMDDMWRNTRGYYKPKKDIKGFLELDLADEEGYGVCRNMASDVAKKLNKINPKYNARTMVVTMEEESYYKIANINRKFIQTNNTVEEQSDNKKDKIAEFTNKIIGNHMVTLVDVPSDGLTVVLDPTNPGIGIYKNGKITMLNPGIEKETPQYTSKELSEAIIIEGGYDSFNDITLDYIDSYKKTKLTMKQIKEKYGLEAQNKALSQVRIKKIVEDLFNEQEKNNKNNFKMGLKAQVSKINYIKAKDNVQENKERD